MDGTIIEKSADLRGEVKIIDIESLMSKDYLLCKIDSVINFDEVYDLNKNIIVSAIGCPCCDSDFAVDSRLKRKEPIFFFKKVWVL